MRCSIRSASSVGGRRQSDGLKRIAAVFWLFAALRAMPQEVHHGTQEKLGEVHFATSCGAAAHEEFNRGVALLHSFQFSGAIEAFDAVVTQDPACAIAYWGMALSDWSNPFAPGQRAAGQLQQGGDNTHLGPQAGAKTAREGDH